MDSSGGEEAGSGTESGSGSESGSEDVPEKTEEAERKKRSI